MYFCKKNRSSTNVYVNSWSYDSQRCEHPSTCDIMGKRKRKGLLSIGKSCAWKSVCVCVIESKPTCTRINTFTALTHSQCARASLYSSERRTTRHTGSCCVQLSFAYSGEAPLENDERNRTRGDGDKLNTHTHTHTHTKLPHRNCSRTRKRVSPIRKDADSEEQLYADKRLYKSAQNIHTHTHDCWLAFLTSSSTSNQHPFDQSCHKDKHFEHKRI